jgi:serine/threonine protein kinase
MVRSVPNRRPQIKRGIFGFPSAFWGHISDEVRDSQRGLVCGGGMRKDAPSRALPAQGQNFIKRLLVVDEGARMTLAEALQHPWLIHATTDDTSGVLPLVNEMPAAASCQ